MQSTFALEQVKAFVVRLECTLPLRLHGLTYTHQQHQLRNVIQRSDIFVSRSILVLVLVISFQLIRLLFVFILIQF